MSNINEQFKEIINEAIDNSFHNNIEMKIILKEWLQCVYSQGTKANEYEMKAKAWDLLKMELDGKNKGILSNPKASDEDLNFAGNNTAVLWEMSDLEMKFKKELESGENDE